MTSKRKDIIHSKEEAKHIVSESGHLIICYLPRLNFDFSKLIPFLTNLSYTRVEYINKYNNEVYSTPRMTWCWAHREGTDINKPINYQGKLSFLPERMPAEIEELSQYVRACAIQNYGFDPEYNSCIIGRYDHGKDEIGFHTDAETFLEHLLCANVTVGIERDFKFRLDLPEVKARNGGKHETHQVTLSNGSLLFFSGVEHSLPKRAAHKPGMGVRYSISLRKINLEKYEIGVGNMMYYCRGHVAALENEQKAHYMEVFHQLKMTKMYQQQQNN